MAVFVIGFGVVDGAVDGVEEGRRERRSPSSPRDGFLGAKHVLEISGKEQSSCRAQAREKEREKREEIVVC